MIKLSDGIADEPGPTLFLCGDVMTGRGLDQILPHPADPRIYEPAASSALRYLELAEAVNGSIPKPVDFTYPWGDLHRAFDVAKPDARIVNLETAITDSARAYPKGINYKMGPGNVACLAAARIDCCVLANNHVLDWRASGLVDTLDALARAGIKTAGAGRNTAEAAAPAINEVGAESRVLVIGLATESSGVPPGWAATADRPGVNLVDIHSYRATETVLEAVQEVRRPGDVVVASIHWGGNWGYTIPAEHRHYARALIEQAGVDVVHGHSSHHPMGIEVHHDRLILYGCGDLLNDYEGIAGYEAFRPELVLAYFPLLSRVGALQRLTMMPFRLRNFRLCPTSTEEAAWLSATLTREGGRLGTRVIQGAAGALLLERS